MGNVICRIDPTTGEPIYNIFSDIRAMWNWDGVAGDNDEMNFYLTDNIYISCRKFERCRNNPYSSSLTADIVLVCNGAEHNIYNCSAGAFKPTSRYYNTIGGILQLGYGNYDYEQQVIDNSETCIVFAVLEAINEVTHTQSAGIYIPKSRGSISKVGSEYIDNPFDPTPFIWITKESIRIVQNTGLAYVTGHTFNQTGIITAKSEISATGYVDITISGDIPGTDLEGKQFSTIDSESVAVSASIIVYEHTAHTITIQIASQSYEHIEVGREYTIADVEYPVRSTWIPIFGLGSECISSGAYVRLQGTGTASSGLGGLWTT